MRSEQEMLRLVRDKVARLRRRRRLAALGAAAAIALVTGIGVGSVLAVGDDQMRIGPARPRDPASQPADRQAVVPGLVGLTVDEAVVELQAAGFNGNPALFQSRYIASDDVELDVVMSQEPPPTTVTGADDPVAIDGSAGGPAISFDELPGRARSFTSQLPATTRPNRSAPSQPGTAWPTRPTPGSSDHAPPSTTPTGPSAIPPTATAATHPDTAVPAADILKTPGRHG